MPAQPSARIGVEGVEHLDGLRTDRSWASFSPSETGKQWEWRVS